MTCFTHIFGDTIDETSNRNPTGCLVFMAETVGFGEFKIWDRIKKHALVRIQSGSNLTFTFWQTWRWIRRKRACKKGNASGCFPPTSVPVKPSRVANWNHQLKACSLTSRLGMAKVDDCFNFFLCTPNKLGKRMIKPVWDFGVPIVVRGTPK